MCCLFCGRLYNIKSRDGHLKLQTSDRMEAGGGVRNSLQSECWAGRNPPLADISFMFLPLWTRDTGWPCSIIQPATKYVYWQAYRAEPALYVRTVPYDSSAENKHLTRNISWYRQINTIYRGKHSVALGTPRPTYSITACGLSCLFRSTNYR